MTYCDTDSQEFSRITSAFILSDRTFHGRKDDFLVGNVLRILTLFLVLLLGLNSKDSLSVIVRALKCVVSSKPLRAGGDPGVQQAVGRPGGRARASGTLVLDWVSV